MRSSWPSPADPDLGDCRAGTCKTREVAWSPARMTIVWQHGPNPEAALELSIARLVSMPEADARALVADWERRVHDYEVGGRPMPEQQDAR